MGIASLIIGIISIIIAFIPNYGTLALILAFIAVIFGIIGMLQRNGQDRPSAMPIIATVISILAIAIIYVWVYVMHAPKRTVNNYPEYEVKTYFDTQM